VLFHARAEAVLAFVFQVVALEEASSYSSWRRSQKTGLGIAAEPRPLKLELPASVARKGDCAAIAADCLLPIRFVQAGGHPPANREIPVGHARLELVRQILAL
jgi:hypothetical protein